MRFITITFHLSSRHRKLTLDKLNLLDFNEIFSFFRYLLNKEKHAIKK